MIPSNTQIISFVQQQLPQDYHINFSQIDDHTVVGHSDNFDDMATVMWQTNNGSIVTLIESKLALSRTKALQAVNDFNARHDFKSHMVHLYLKDDNRVVIYMKQRLREDSEEYIKKWVGGTTLIGLNILGWWSNLWAEEAKAKMQAEEEARKAAQAVLAQEEARKRMEAAKREAEQRRMEEEQRKRAAEQKKKDEENRKKAEKEKKIAEYEMKIARMRSEVVDAEARVADLKTRVGKFLSFTSKSDVDKARAEVARKKAELAKLRLELKELKG